MSSDAAAMSSQARMRMRRITVSKQRERARRLVNAIMLGLTGLATLIALVPLVWIIVDVFLRGSQFLTLDFLTQTFKPTSLGGGGVWHAIVGTLELIAIASALSIPIGILAA